MASALEFANSWFIRSRDNGPLLKPASEKYSDQTLQGLKPALRMLSSPRCLGICRFLLNEEPDRGWSEEVLSQLPGWSNLGENFVLMTIAALCRTGVFKFDETWKSTPLGNEMKFNWHKMAPADATRQLWSPYLRAEYLRTLQWAWDTLKADSNRKLLTRVLSDANGFRHSKLPVNGIGRNRALRVVAASASVGALWFTGWSWEPTLYGAWLINHPDSPLNSNEF